MQSYADDYPNKAFGLLQEAIQNAIDARASLDNFAAVSVVIRYDSERRNLAISDHGTSGMYHCQRCSWGKRNDSVEDCHEKDCRWGNFHYLGGLAKGPANLGYRGLGKSLLLVAGERLTVRTKLAAEGVPAQSMASQWDRVGEDWFWSLKPSAAFEADSSPGTEFILEGVNEEVHQELLDTKAVQRNISLTWFPAIDKGVRIRYGVGSGSLERVGSPKFPRLRAPAQGQPASRQRGSVPVTVGHQIVGELKSLELRFAADPVEEAIRGIALVRNGTQVIERLASWGRKVPIELQDRLYGWVDYETTEERPFLYLCEKPGHRGFTPHPYFRRVRELLQQQVEEFLLPLAKQAFKPSVTEKDRRRAQQNLGVIQKALEEVSDFNPWSGEGLTPRRREKRPDPTHPYISRVDLDKEAYKRDEVAEVAVVLMNPTQEHQGSIHLSLEALDMGLSQLVVEERPAWELPFLGPAHGSEKGRSECNFSIPITADFLPGRNWVRVTLFNRPRSSSDKEEALPENTFWDRSAHALWVDEVPRKVKRAATTGGSSGEGGRRGTLSQLVPITAPLDPIEQEIIPMWPQGEFWFNTKGARIGPVYESDPRTSDTILYELAAEAIGERILELKMDTDVRESLAKDQVVDELKQLDGRRKRFLQVCERLRSALAK